MGALLVVGAWAQDADATLGGSGGIAAIAAAPLAPTQAWGRGPRGCSPQVRGLLNQRGIDLSGVDWNAAADSDALGGLAPTSAHAVGAALLCCLSSDELGVARRVVAQLEVDDGDAEVPVMIAIGHGQLAHSIEHLRGAELVIVPASDGPSVGISDPLALAKRLQQAGAKTVAVTAGAFGGLLAYQSKLTTWSAWPVEALSSVSVLPAFSGALAAWCAGSDATDFATIKRGLGVASAVGSLMAQGGVRRLIGSTRDDYIERFTKLRRDAKG